MHKYLSFPCLLQSCITIFSNIYPLASSPDIKSRGEFHSNVKPPKGVGNLQNSFSRPTKKITNFELK